MKYLPTRNENLREALFIEEQEDFKVLKSIDVEKIAEFCQKKYDNDQNPLPAVRRYINRHYKNLPVEYSCSLGCWASRSSKYTLNVHNINGTVEVSISDQDGDKLIHCYLNYFGYTTYYNI